MNTADSNLGPEDPHGEHPEIRDEDAERKLPASAGSKQNLLTKLSERIGPRPEDPRTRWSHDFFDSQEQRSVHLSQFDLGANQVNPSEVATVLVSDLGWTDRPRRQEFYHFIEAPDGLEVEPAQSLLPPMRRLDEAVRPYQDSDDAEVLAALYEIRKQPQVASDERAMGLRFFSERDAKDLLAVLERMEPYPTR